MDEKIKINDLFEIYDNHKFYVNMDFYKNYGWVVLKPEVEND